MCISLYGGYFLYNSMALLTWDRQLPSSDWKVLFHSAGTEAIIPQPVVVQCFLPVAFIASYPFTRAVRAGSVMWAVHSATAVSSGGSGVCTGSRRRAGVALRCDFNPPGMLQECCLCTHRLLRISGC